MRETLYIRISSQAEAPIQWLIVAKELADEIASGVIDGKAQLIELATKAQGRDVKVLVNSQAIGFKALQVPGKNSRAWQTAAPYMLEEELANDVEQLFFAYGSKPKDYHGDENVFVAWLAHNQLQQWLTWFDEAGIKVTHMIPDVLCMPQHQAASMVNIADQCLLRIDGFSGFVVDKSLLPMALEQLAVSRGARLDTSSDQPVPPRLTVHNYGEPSLAIEHQAITWQAQPLELPMLLLAKEASKQSFNLLQGQYQVKKQQSPVMKNWLWVTGLASVALLLTVLGKVVELQQLDNQYAQVSEQIERRYKQAFPNTKRVRLATVKSQIQRRLAEFGSSAGDESFLSMLNDLQPAFASATSIKPTSIRFDSKRQELRLSVEGKDYQSFEKFKQQLESANFDVQAGAQNNQGDQITGSFSIRSKS
ncbi:type II secretion system protein GspL [Thalassotalea maritima]|uniref:type II secretion system protein GspL n=1 Tax=Thalassotalea maritima TaxID=3242416 RepID=UPI003529BB75